MSDQGWNTPQDPNAGQDWSNPPPGGPPPGGQTPPPPNPAGDWGQAPGGNPPQWGQQPPPAAPPAQQGGQPAQQWGQQPPPQQGGQWGQQPGQPGQQNWGQQGPGGPQQSGGIDPPIAGILAYLFGWIGGLVIYLVNKDHLSRFHGAQSILLNIAFVGFYIALFIVTTLLAFISDFFGLLFFFVPFVGLAVLGLAIYLMVKAYQGEKVVLPVIGPIAESWANK